jgi:hypothetical protein
LAIVATARWLISPGSAGKGLPELPPLPDRSGPPTIGAADLVGSPETQANKPLPPWPTETTTGDRARAITLAYLTRAKQIIDKIPSYSATLRRRESINGKFGPEQTLLLKARHNPFSIYLQFLAPKKGKEALYVEGERDGKVMAHNGDWTRRLIPLLEVDPTSPLAMKDNRHPITDAGLEKLVNRLLYFRQLDIRDNQGSVTCDRVVDEVGKEWYRYITLLPEPDGLRPFHRVDVYLCPEIGLPLRIRNYEWPASDSPSNEPVLVETYAYDDLNLDAGLSSADFDPHNPEYAFYTK